jgi:hypothetical protein
MTQLYSPEIDFGNWYYIKDPTHVFIYQSATMEWIRRKQEFSSCTLQDRLVTLVNPTEIQPDTASASSGAG